MPHDGFLAQVIEAKRPVGKDRGENTEPANQAMIMMIGRPQLLLGILACYFFRGERKALGNEVSEVREKGGPAGEGRSSNQKTKRAAWPISGNSQRMRRLLRNRAYLLPPGDYSQAGLLGRWPLRAPLFRRMAGLQSIQPVLMNPSAEVIAEKVVKEDQYQHRWESPFCGGAVGAEQIGDHRWHSSFHLPSHRRRVLHSRYQRDEAHSDEPISFGEISGDFEWNTSK